MKVHIKNRSATKKRLNELIDVVSSKFTESSDVESISVVLINLGVPYKISEDMAELIHMYMTEAKTKDEVVDGLLLRLSTHK